MKMVDQERIKDLIRKSRKQFFSSYAGEREKILTALLTYLRTPDEETISTLHRRIHSLKGVSSTLDLANISDLAAEAESLVEDTPSTLHAEPEKIVVLLKLFAQLDVEVERSRTEREKEETKGIVPPASVPPLEEASLDVQENEVKITEEEREMAEETTFKPRKAARILVLDDDTTMLSILEDILRTENYEVLLSSNPLEAMELFLTEKIDLAIIDVLMPKKSGFDVHKYILDQKLEIPVVLLTALKQDSVKIKAARHGIDHLLTKPFRTEDILAIVESVIGKQREDRVESIKDDLTGAFTRKFFNDRYKTEVKRHQASGEKLSVAFVDLDGFHEINDDYGHATGDQLLKKFYTLIRARLDLNVEIFRYGGDDFVLLFPWTSGGEAEKILEEFRIYVEDYGFHVDEMDRTLHLTISAGVAEVEEYEMPLSDVLKMAEEALHYAKSLGRNRIAFRPEKVKLKSKRILVVDDSPFILELIRNRLTHLGYELDYAEDGEEALEKIKSFQPELILLDLMLPKLNGLEVIKRMNEEIQGEKPPIIVVSAKSKEKDIVSSFSLGAKDFITKPFSLEVMEEKIKKYIS